MRDDTLAGSLFLIAPAQSKKKKKKVKSGQVPKTACRILWRQEKTQVGKEVTTNSIGFIIVLPRQRIHKRNGQIWGKMSLSTIYITAPKTKSITFLTFLGDCLAMGATKQTKKSCRASLSLVFQEPVLFIQFILFCLLCACILLPERLSWTQWSWPTMAV